MVKSFFVILSVILSGQTPIARKGVYAGFFFSLIFILPAQVSALTCQDLDGAYVYSQELTPVYLGFFGGQFSSESIINEYGTYGSPYSSLSVRNEYGTYGSPYSTYSANNDYTSYPPEIYKYGVLIGHLTTNSIITDGVSLAAIDVSCTFYSVSPATGSPPPPPSPPSTFTASDGTFTDIIRLTWSTAAGATQYNVYYATSLTGTKNYISSTTSTTMDIIGATPDYVYYFWVSASNLWGEGALSNPDSGYMAGIYYTVSVSKSGNGFGTISSNPAGISCGSDCTQNYLSGTSVTLSANANSGSTASWDNCTAAGGTASGNGTAVATCTFSDLDANKTVTATFTLDTYTVTANATGSGAGSVSSNVGGINYTYPTTSTATSTALNHGSSITLTASANIGSTVSWSGCSSTGGTSTAATCTFSSLDANKTVTATFVINTYTVTPSAGANGSITPSTPQTVNHALTTAFTVTPDIGYHINSVSGCGGSLDGNTYTTGPIIADCTVSATFAIDTFTVTPSPGANGSMTPSTPQTVNYNDTMVFTVTPDNGYRIETVTGCSGSLIGDIFTTGPVTNDCTVTATFSLGGYTVTPSASANGSITPSTPQTVNHALTTAFTVTPDIGYHINSVSGCGGSLDGNAYTTGPIIADCTVSATFAIDTFIVTPSPGANGSMTPSTSQTVNYNDAQIFTVTPDTGYQISSVSGCGGSLDGNAYTTSPITADCTVSATFAIATFTVTPNPGANGSITPSTPQTVNYNDTMVFTVTPDNGYRIETVTGCSGSLIGDIFTTGPVTNDCTVTATFSLGGYTVTPSAGANGTISPSTPQTVNHGLTIAFTITPDLNYHIDHVNGCGGNLVGNIYTTGPIMGDCSVSATFAIYTYELIVNITGKGLVTSDPIGISCNDDCSEMYDNGTLVTLTATPQGGSTFVGWSGDCVGTDLTCDVTVDQVRNVSAEFTSPFPWTMFLPVLTNNKQP